MYEAILQSEPQHFDALQLLGALATQRHEPARALVLFDQALRINPRHAACHNNRGNALDALQQYAAALESYELALHFAPAYAEGYFNRANTQARLWQWDAALASYARALEIEPDYADAHHNLGNTLRDSQQMASALLSYAAALKLRPGDAEIHFNDSLCRLLMGDFVTGWPSYEWRWQRRESPARTFALPLWLGQQSLQYKTILLHSEQGLGDTLQFCRYARQVAALGATVLLEVPACLTGLLGKIDGVTRVFASDTETPAVDYHCPLLSLPLALQASTGGAISALPYVTSDPQKYTAWQATLGQRSHTRVGLVWSGSTGHEHDAQRSIALATFSPLLAQAAQFYCLQQEVRPADRTVLDKTPQIRFFGSDLHDFSDTAALVALMDLVITVDTSVAHLAGAMGKEVWILLPYSPDWRWMLERSDSPWYASARLFRQAQAGDWHSVLAEVAAAFEARPAALTAPVQTVLAQALALHQQGQLDQAETLYRQIIAAQPRHFDALQLLAALATQRNDFSLALNLFDRALAQQPLDAAACNNRGNALYGLKRFASALDSYAQALRSLPDFAEAHFNLANTLSQLERHALALDSYARALQLKPDYGAAYHNRGNTLRQLKRPRDALDSYARALQLMPDDANLHNNRGHALSELELPAEALESYNRALQLAPDQAEIYLGRGNALDALKQPQQALESYQRALALKLDDASLHHNHGYVLIQLHQFEAALESFERALQCEPDHVESHHKRGNILLRLKRTEAALASYEQALHCEPEHVEAHFSCSLCRLLMGDFARGWAQYEWRWKKTNVTPRPFTQALWLGQEDLNHKTILLHSEQGLGDTIQFCRYASAVAALGATVLLQAPQSLKALLGRLSGVTQVFGMNESVPETDFHCPLLSLPLAFGADLVTISGLPYLSSAPQASAAWAASLGPASGPRVGLVWSGSTLHEHDEQRSIPLDVFKIVLNDKADFHCLQSELREADRAVLAQTAIQFWGAALPDFSATAALIGLMDLVITVDTSVAHLAGAMGKPVWLLVPFNPDWRWLLERDDSPWYSSVKLLRQPVWGDWQSVLVKVAAELKQYATQYVRQAGELSAAPLLARSAIHATLKRAFGLHQGEQFDQAEVLYKEIVRAEPAHFDALQMLAAICLHRQDFSAALLLFEQAMVIVPEHADLHNNYGLALHQLQRFDAALASYERAIELKPDYPEACNNRGLTLAALKRPDQALRSYEQALRLKPDYADAYNNQGSVLMVLQDWPQALVSYERALQIRPDYAQAHHNRGLALVELKRLPEALTSYEQALWFKPGYAEAYNSRGVALMALKQLPQAVLSYEQALACNPYYVDAHSNHGVALMGLQQLAQALLSYQHALDIDPDHIASHVNEGFCRLLMGDFARGWQKNEWRWARHADPLSTLACPLWLGRENLHQKTILLYSEQGLGDTIQCSRYIKQVAALGARIILLVPASLQLLLRQIGGVVRVMERLEHAIEADYRCPLMSLPLAFQSDLTSISNLPYLQSDPLRHAQWQARLGPARKKRIGLAWRGNAEHSNDAQRSITLAAMAMIFNIDADFFCLQPTLNEADGALLAHTPLQFFGAALHDFSDTAALTGLMDLIITVDTSAAHLAGAMGRPVWIMLPFNPDWRWLLERDDSPWYGSARLWRQPRPDDWPSVLSEVALALQQMIKPSPLSAGPVLTPAAIEATLSTAFALHQADQFDPAEVLYKEILQSQPKHFNALQMLAAILLHRKDFSAALELFEQARAIDPSHADLYNNCGLALRELDQYEAALASYERAVQLRPSYPEAYNNRGIILVELKRFPQALLSYEAALRLKPDYADAHNNLGIALMGMRQLEPALASYEQALRLKPDYPEALNNRGIVLMWLQRLPEALASYEQASRLKPDHVDAHLNEGFCRLMMADFARGWEKYEWRWAKDADPMNTLTCPLWLGQETLKNKTILLYSEQGLGDTIQFSRYATQVAALGARVILLVPLPLLALLQKIEGAAMVLDRAGTWPEADYRCPLMSLPLACQTDLASISARPYLHSTPRKQAQWQARLGPQKQLRIGLVWRGNAEHSNDAHRSITLDALAILFRQAADFYCLQPELSGADLALLAGTPVQFFGAALQDFSDTAALLELMDLVITIDTSVAHLAGAMGKEVWILLPFNPDWRWMQGREDSPWYGSARLFRQSDPGQWGPVLAHIAAQLGARC